VLCCVILASLLGLSGLYTSVVEFARDASGYATLDSLDREYGDSEGQPLTLRHRTVVETALRVVPERASYRVLIGDAWQPLRTTKWTTSLERDFVKFYLLPRRLTDSISATWILCFGCDLGRFGGHIDVVARSSDGLMLLRTRRD